MGKSPRRARSPPRVRTSRPPDVAQGLRSQTDNPNALPSLQERLVMDASSASNQQVPSRGHSPAHAQAARRVAANVTIPRASRGHSPGDPKQPAVARPSSAPAPGIPASVAIHRRAGGLGFARRRARSCSIPGRRSRTDSIGGDDDGQRRIRPTEVSASRRSLPPSNDVQHQKRAPPTRRPPPRSLPAWSDVHARRPLIAGLHVDCRRRPRATGTSPHPDKSGKWR
jgi:hypothetical protein